jgi:hypothetical protein
MSEYSQFQIRKQMQLLSQSHKFEEIESIGGENLELGRVLRSEKKRRDGELVRSGQALYIYIFFFLWGGINVEKEEEEEEEEKGGAS